MIQELFLQKKYLEMLEAQLLWWVRHQTCQETITEVQFCDISEISNIQGHGEACAATQRDAGAIYFHSDDGKRQLSCLEWIT